jgi:AcrR family transcriptional regulator
MAPATRRRRMPAAQRREVILAAAEETFARCGYHGASLDEVASAAGVSKALIYEHFTSKRELHASLLDAHASEIFARLQAGAGRGQTGDERLRSGIDAFLGWVEEHREAWRALFRDAAEPDVAALARRLQGQATGVIAELVASDPDAPPDLGRDAPDRALRIEIHAQLLSGAVQSLATWWDDRREIPRAVLVDRAMAFCGHSALRAPALAAAMPAQAPAREPAPISARAG